MKLIKELLGTLSEGIELGEDPGADDLYDKLSDMLLIAGHGLKRKERENTSFSIGGNFRAGVSGKVDVENNYWDHPSGGYGSPIRWKMALKVGNNIDGDALGEVKSLFNKMLDLAESYQTKKVEKFNGIFHAYFDSGSVSCKMEYATNYCWIGINKS